MEGDQTVVGEVLEELTDSTAQPGPTFQVDRTRIESVAIQDQSEELRALGITVYDQSKFEEGILRQVDDALEEQEKRKKQNAEKKEKIRPKETGLEKMVRLGKMTPFGTVLNGVKSAQELSSFEKYLLEQERLRKEKCQQSIKGKALKPISSSATSGSVGPKPAKEGASDDEYIPDKDKSSQKKKITPKKRKPTSSPEESVSSRRAATLRERRVSNEDEWKTDDSDWQYSSDDEATPSKRRKTKNRVMDDGNVNDYRKRLAEWSSSSSSHEEVEYHELDGGFRIPLSIWDRLYDYQKIGVQWMWELRLQRCGGILGDEMGLGKTIQVIAFLAGLAQSRLITRLSSYRGLGPVLLVTNDHTRL